MKGLSQLRSVFIVGHSEAQPNTADAVFWALIGRRLSHTSNRCSNAHKSGRHPAALRLLSYRRLVAILPRSAAFLSPPATLPRSGCFPTAAWSPSCRAPLLSYRRLVAILPRSAAFLSPPATLPRSGAILSPPATLPRSGAFLTAAPPPSAAIRPPSRRNPTATLPR
jgi:hypothetical protein